MKNSIKNLLFCTPFILYGCNPEPIANVVYATPDGKRELYAYAPPYIKNTNDLNEVSEVNIVFCRWSGGTSKKHFGTDNGIPSISLHCNFDSGTQRNRGYRRPTFFTMSIKWEVIGKKEYKVSSFILKTPNGEIKLSEKRSNCSDNTCGLVFHNLELPNTKEDNLKFNFSVDTEVRETVEYKTKLIFEGYAPRTPGR